MDKPSKCKNCQWYGKPYWSIINPCDNCPMENVETFTRWIDPTIEEQKKEIDRLNNIINKAKIKIESMFNVGDETKIIDDLLELNKILSGSDEK